MATKLREQCRVSYPGRQTATLNVIIPNLTAANHGDKGMQAFIANQYFRALGYAPPTGWEWRRFSITPLGTPGRPPRHSRVAPATRPSTGQCCADDNCKSCDIGAHERCRDCTISR